MFSPFFLLPSFMLCPFCAAFSRPSQYTTRAARKRNGEREREREREEREREREREKREERERERERERRERRISTKKTMGKYK